MSIRKSQAAEPPADRQRTQPPPTPDNTSGRPAQGQDAPLPSLDLPPILLVLAALVLTVVAALAVWDSERQRSVNRLAEQAGEILPQIQQSVREQQSLASELARFMALAEAHRSPQFERIAGDAVEQRAGVELVAWTQPENGPTALAEALAGPFRLVAWHQAGAQGTAMLDALNTFTTEQHEAALDRAIRTGRTTVSDGMVLFIDGERRHPGVIFFHPVYADPDRDVLDGVVKIGIRLDRLINQHLTSDRFAIYLFDITGNEPSMLFAGGDQPSARPASATLQDLSRRVHHQQRIEVGDRQWSMWLVPTTRDGLQDPLIGWLTLIGGGGVTIALAFLGVWRQRRLQYSHTQLAERSRHLTEALRRVEMLETGSRKLYQAAGEAEERYRLLSEYAGDMISQHTPDGRTVYVSSACRDLLGYTPDEVCRMPRHGLVHPDYLEQVLKGHEARLRDEDRFTATYPLVHKDGHTVWVESSHRVRRDEDGNPVEILIVSRDVSHRRRASRALRESELLFRSVFDDAAVGMALFDPVAGSYTKVNQALCSMLGYTRSELLEMSYRDITHPADLHLTPRHMRQVLLGQNDAFRIEKRYLRKNGEVLWVLVNAALVRDRNGQPTHLSAQVQDISDLKHAEQALELLNRQQDLILNAAAEGIFGLDVRGTVAFVNRAASEMLGHQVEDMLGRPMFDLVDGEGNAEDWPVIRSMRERAVRHVTDADFRRSNGDCFAVEYTSAPIIDDERVTGVVVVFADISERKAVALQLQAYSEELERGNCELQAFARVTLGSLQEPLAELDPLLGLTSGAARSRIHHLSKRLQALADGLEAFAGSERAADAANPVELGKVIRQAAANLAPLCARMEVRLTIGDMPRVGGHPRQLERLFQHLIYCLLSCSREPEQIIVAAETTDTGWDIRLSTADSETDVAALQTLFAANPTDQPPDQQMAVALCRRIVCSHGGRLGLSDTGAVMVHFPTPP